MSFLGMDKSAGGSGLVRAGTDVYYPPFGGLVTDYVTATGSDPGALKPYGPTGTDPRRMAELKAFKGPFSLSHFGFSFDDLHHLGEARNLDLILLLPRLCQVVCGLQAKPCVRTTSERLFQSDSHFRGDHGLFIHEIIQCLTGYPKYTRGLGYAQVKRLYALLSDQAARMRGVEHGHDETFWSVVVQ